MDLRLWEMFVLLAEHRHYGRAARSVGIAQPALSQYITQLERVTRCRLFDRTTRSVELTAAGAALLPEVRALLRSVRALSNAADGFERRTTGRVRFGTPALLGATLPDQILRRLAGLDEVDAEFETRALTSAQVLDALVEGTVDFVVTHHTHRSGRGDEEIATSAPVAVDPRGVVVAPGHRLAAAPVLRAADLAGERAITLAPDRFGVDTRRFTAGLPLADGPGVVVGNVEELVDACWLGRGVCVAPLSDAGRFQWNRRVDPALPESVLASVPTWLPEPVVPSGAVGPAGQLGRTVIPLAG